MRAIDVVRVVEWIREEAQEQHVPPLSKDEWRQRCMRATNVFASFEAIAAIADEIGVRLEARPRARLTNDDLLKALVVAWDERKDAIDDRFADLMEDLRGRIAPSEPIEAKLASANADKGPLPDCTLPF